MNRFHPLVIAAAAAALPAIPALADATGAVRFDYGDTLLVAPEAGAAKAACQPLKGETADVTGPARLLFGTEVLPLRVTSGRCQGTTGWAGVPRLAAAAPGAAPIAAAGGARFGYSDSLLKSRDPRDGKASCQPLKGDPVQILETAQAMGTSIARVRVLAGRCANAEGWAGTPRLEAP